MSFENALLYTLSTITQSLGGAIALVGSFVLLRYQLINSNLGAAAKTLIDVTPISPALENEVRGYLARGRYGQVRLKLTDSVKLFVQSGNNNSIEADAAYNQIRIELNRRITLLREFSFALATSLVIMALSTAALAGVPYILSTGSEKIVLIFAVLAFCLSLLQFGHLIYRQVDID